MKVENRYTLKIVGLLQFFW